jgi:poly-gamma-glutamate synthesis protein (capsule biosynthesis protein)
MRILAVVLAVRSMDEKPIRIGLAGDVMLGRLVAEAVQRHGYSYPWGDLLPELRAFDRLLINLEMALTRRLQAEPKVFNFRAAPELVQSLKLAGVDCCALANNHIRDFGVAGMLETIEVLDGAGIAHAGAGNDLSAARRCARFDAGGARINVLSATDNEPSWAATHTDPGVLALDWRNPAPLLEAVTESARDADCTILSLHWGPNMRTAPSARFVRFAHDAIDAGATLVHGHSAHVLQGIEFYRGGVILYDCGDFVDDYMVDPRLRNDRSVLFELEISADRTLALRVLPTQIDRMQVNRAGGSARAWVLRRLARCCEPFGTALHDEGEWIAIKTAHAAGSWMNSSVA